MRNRFLFVAILLVPILVGCVARRTGVSWPDVTVLGDEQNILVSYEDFMVLVNPLDGSAIPLVNSEGVPRTDEEGNPLPWEITDDEADGARFYTTPIVRDDDTLLIANYNNSLITANQPNARVIDAEFATIDGKMISDLVVAEGILYISLSNAGLVALDYNDPTQELWSFDINRGAWSSPVVEDGIVYVSSVNHNLYALSATTGEEIWSLNLDGGIASSPLYADGHLYVGTFNHTVFDISVNGEILAEFEANDWIWSTPVLYENVLYVTDLSGSVYALDTTRELDIIWQNQVSEEGIRPSPLVTEDFVIVVDRSGRIFWLERLDGQPYLVEGEEGLEPLERTVDAEVLSELIVVDFADEEVSDMLIVSTTNKGRLLTGFTLNDGQRRWGYGR